MMQGERKQKTDCRLAVVHPHRNRKREGGNVMCASHDGVIIVVAQDVDHIVEHLMGLRCGAWLAWHEKV